MSIRFLSGVNVDQNTLFVDDANNRVGIGTDSPSHSLHISGLSTSAIAFGGTSLKMGSYTGIGTTRIFSNGLYLTYSTADSYHDFANSGSSLMRITNTGNVGIGTTSPAQKLDVSGNAQVQGVLYVTKSGENSRFNSADANGPYVSFRNNGTAKGYIGSGFHLWTSPNNLADNFGIRAENQLDFGIGASVKMTLDSSGNVGIGTTSPGSKLHVLGSGKFEVTGTSYGNEALNLYNPDGSTTQVGGVAFKLQSGDFYSQFEAYHKSSGAGEGIAQFGTYDTNSRIVIYSGSSSQQLENSFYKLVVNSNTAAYVTSTGNVGIGTTSPLAKLDVEGAQSNFVARFSNSTTTGYAPGSIILEAGQSAARGQGIYHYNTPADESWFTGVPYDVYSKKWIVANNYATTFDPNVAQLSYALMTIDSDTGNVGIGTTSPAYALDVNGDIRGNAYRIGGGTVLSGLSTVYVGSGGATGAVGLVTTSGQGLTLNGGNVGIGTTSPNHRLDIYSNENVPLRIHRPSNANLDSSGAWGIGFSTRGDANNSTTDTRAGIFSYYNGNLFLAAANTSIVADPDAYARLTVSNTGYIGIGTMSPTTTLDVVSSAMTNVDIAHFANSNQVAKIKLSLDGVGSSLISMLDAGNNEDVRLSTQGFSWLNAGNVGIGTTSPSDKLDVFGDLRVSYDASNYFTIEPLSNGNAYFKASGGSLHFAQPAKNNQIFLYDYTGATTRWGEYDASSITLKTSTNATGILLNTDGNSYINTGNVGIGTASPGYKLHVVGDTRIEGNLTINGTVTQIDTDTLTTEQWLVTNDGTGPAVVINQKGSQPVIDIQDDGVSSFYIADGGNVGIGTTSPATKLHVYNQGTAMIRVDSDSVSPYKAGIEFIRSSINGGRIYNDGGAVQVKIESDFGYDSLNPTRGGFVFRTAPVTSGTLVDALRIDARGYVGIGTTSPSFKLHVLGTGGGDSTFTSGILIDNNNATDGEPTLAFRVNSMVAGGNYWMTGLNQSANYKIAYGTSFTDANTMFSILAGGNVGIGTTSPAEKLVVSGSGVGIAIDGTTSSRTYYNRSGAYIWSTGLRAGDTKFHIFDERATDRLVIDDYGNVGIGTTSPGSTLDIVSSGINIYRATDTDGQYRWRVDQNFDMFMTNSAGVDKSGIKNDGSAYFLGNVGIGTTSPDYNLKVIGATWSDYIIAGSDSTYGDPYRTVAFGNVGDGNNRILASRTTSDGMYFMAATGQGFNFRPNGGTANLVVINSSGNVGVGTSSPEGGLHVASSSSGGIGGQIVIDNPAGSTLGNTAEISFLTDAGASGTGTRNARILAVNENAGNGAANMQFHTWNGAASAERMRITSGGNVGIGTTSPASKLHVYNGASGATPYATGLTVENSGRVSLNLLSPTANDSYVFFGNPSAGNAGYVGYENTANRLVLKSNDYVSLLDSTGEVIRIDGGNVGIGTTSPASYAKLTVNGNVRIGNGASDNVLYGGFEGAILNQTAYQGYNIVYSGGDFQSVKLGGTNDPTNYYYNTTHVFGNRSNAERMRITSAGNVGIGTTTPLYKLDVDGAIHLRGESNTFIRTIGSNNTDQTIIRIANSNQTDTSDYGFSIKYMGTRSGNDNSLSIFSDNQNAANQVEAVTIAQDGKIGLGVASPTQKLHVIGNTVTTGVAYTDIVQTWSGTSIDFRHQDASVVMRVDTANARVGIGTTSPSQKLDIAGGHIKISSAGYGLLLPGSINTSAQINFKNVGTQSELMKFPASNYTVTLYGATDRIYYKTDKAISNQNVLSLGTDGNVGIGTTSPGYKLHVVGDTRIEGNLTINGTVTQIDTDTLTTEQWLVTNDGTGPAVVINQKGSQPVIDIQDDGTSVLYIEDGGNVGIGTTSPSQKLDVANGGIGFSGTGLNATDKKLYSPADGVLEWMTHNSAGEHGFAVSHQGSKKVFLNTSGNSYLIGGNLGIGTASPSYALHAVGDVALQGNDILLGASGLTTYARFVNAGANYLYAESGGTLSFGSNGATNNIFIATSGDVGIGTTSPSAKLHIASVSSNASAILASNYYARASFGEQGGSGDVHFGSSGYGSPTIGSQDYGFYAAHNAYRSSTGAWKHSRTSTIPAVRYLGSAGVSGGTSGFYWDYSSNVGTGDITWTNLMRLDTNGNLGIGTTSPTQKLDVSGSILAQSSGYVTVRVDQTDSGMIDMGITSGTTEGFLNIQNTGAGHVADNPQFKLLLNTSEKIRINSSGNVGIGTTSPGAKLDVNGDVYINSNYPSNVAANDLTIGKTTTGDHGLTIVTSNSNTAGIFFADNDNNDAGRIKYQHSNNSMRFETNRSEAMRIDASGNVGIGTTSPSSSYKLDVAGAIRTTVVSGYTIDASATFGDNSGGTITIINRGTTRALRILGTTSSGWGDVLINPYGAYVGIGTTSPTRLLDVSAVNPQMTLKSTTTTGFSEYYFSDSDGDPGYLSYAHNGDYLSIGVNGSDRMRITSAGNVGIGTTNPTTKLHVTGITQITEAGNAAFYGGNYVRVFNDQNFNFRNVGGSTIANISVSGSSFFNGGNVGIGTTSPSTKLHVVGYSRTDGGLVLNGSDANYREMIFTTSAAARWNLYAYGGESGSNSGSVLYLARYADNGDFIANVATFLRTNGYVGIATTTPTQQLHVSGNVRVTGAYYDSNNSAGTSGQVLSSTGSGTAWVNQGEATATSLFDLLPAARVTYDWTVQLTAGTWADIFSSTTVLSSGTWMVQAFVSDYAVGGQQYSETYSGVMSWGSADNTNNGDVDATSEVILHRSGHAANSGNFYLRTVERSQSTLLLQGMSNLSHTASTTINFKFVKIF